MITPGDKAAMMALQLFSFALDFLTDADPVKMAENEPEESI